MKKFLIISLIFFILHGCASIKPMTRQEFLNATQRTYTNVTPNEVLLAAEKLFILSDGNDYSFQHTDNEIIASRQWTVFLILAALYGTDTWKVSASKTEKGTDVQVLIGTTTSQTTPLITGKKTGDFTTGTQPGISGKPPEGPATYKIFWARMDYLLGKTDKWMTCDDYFELKERGETYGLATPLCDVITLDDRLPKELRKEVVKPTGPK